MANIWASAPPAIDQLTASFALRVATAVLSSLMVMAAFGPPISGAASSTSVTPTVSTWNAALPLASTALS